MTTSVLQNLVDEYDRSLLYTDSLLEGLTPDQVAWRPEAESSAIGWHLGHQGAVSHFMLRNLTAAEPSIDTDIDALMDSATPERDRGQLPSLDRIHEYRSVVAERVRYRIRQIDAGEIGSPNHLPLIATTMLSAIINHEYQHSKWIGEVRNDTFGFALPANPVSPCLSTADGYVMITAPG